MRVGSMGMHQRNSSAPSNFGLGEPSFWAPLTDSGNGAVNTALARGIGAISAVRATAAACRLSSGLWKLDVASGVMRSHYRPFSAGVQTYCGFLAEPLATQILSSADVRDMTTAAWVAVNGTAVKNAIGIDGVANAATTLTATAGNATFLLTLAAAAVQRCYSNFMRRVSGSGNIQVTQDGATWTTVTVATDFPDLAQRLVATQLNPVIGVRIVTLGDSVVVDCNQYEAGAQATTPIPAAGTRNADILSYVFAGNLLTTAGAIYGEASTIWTANTSGTIMVATGTVDSHPLTINGAGVTQTATLDTAAYLAKTGLSSLATGVRKRFASWGPTGRLVTGDGLAPATGVFAALTGTNITIANRSSSALSLLGTMKNVKGWRHEANAQQAQAITG